MRRLWVLWLLLSCLMPAVAQAADHTAADHKAARLQPTEPFRIIGNVYYVGTEGVSAYLVTGDKGHVLLDVGMEKAAPLVAANIRKLGFRLKDIHIILINHAHYDHSGGLAEMKRLTGAKLWASAGDKPALEAGKTPGRRTMPTFPPVKVDHVVADGERLVLGSVSLTAMLTPGHTKGCTSWETETAGKTMLFACSLTVAGQRLEGSKVYPEAGADFRATFARLHDHKADIYVNFHPETFGMAAKRARLEAGDANAFVDPGELRRRVEQAQKSFERKLVEQRERHSPQS